ncbi:MAG: uracil-DNA glycosylase [Candidatus Delongbacteria bacterium]|nr:uracil-DNA glycosylase [Candidatus Delongbacteria bacterium]
MEKHKGLLLEYLRGQLVNYFNYYKNVYSDTLPISIAGFKMNYSFSSDSIKNDLSSKPKELEIITPNIMNDDNKREVRNINSLDQLKDAVENCKLCELHKTRINTVFGSGSDRSKLVIIGEAPGAEEDKTGLPFVGRSGKLLTKMLEAIGFSRDDVFICNVLKCRPPKNRDPKSDEIKQCSMYLDKQLEILKPKYILALGRIAAKRILNKDLAMKDFRKEIHSYNNIPVMVTYHPSALLRNPKWKYDAWEDLQSLKSNLNN